MPGTILTEHMDDLHTVSKALLEYETLSRDEIDQILRGEKIVRDDTGGRRPRPPPPRVGPDEFGADGHGTGWRQSRTAAWRLKPKD